MEFILYCTNKNYIWAYVTEKAMALDSILDFGLGSGVIKKAKLGGVSLEIRNMTFLIIVLIYIGLYPSLLGEEMEIFIFALMKTKINRIK